MDNFQLIYNNRTVIKLNWFVTFFFYTNMIYREKNYVSKRSLTDGNAK